MKDRVGELVTADVLAVRRGGQGACRLHDGTWLHVSFGGGRGRHRIRDLMDLKPGGTGTNDDDRILGGTYFSSSVIRRLLGEEYLSDDRELDLRIGVDGSPRAFEEIYRRLEQVLAASEPPEPTRRATSPVATSTTPEPAPRTIVPLMVQRPGGPRRGAAHHADHQVPRLRQRHRDRVRGGRPARAGRAEPRAVPATRRLGVRTE